MATAARRNAIKIIPKYDILKAENFLSLEILLCIHEQNQQDSQNKFQLCQDEFKSMVTKFLIDKRPEEGFIEGMKESDFIQDGKKIWEKALFVRRKINNVFLPAFERQLVDKKLPSGKNIDEVMELTLQTLEEDANIEKARSDSAYVSQQSQASGQVNEDENGNEEAQTDSTRTTRFKIPNEWIAFKLRAKPAKFYLDSTGETDIYKPSALVIINAGNGVGSGTAEPERADGSQSRKHQREKANVKNENKRRGDNNRGVIELDDSDSDDGRKVDKEVALLEQNNSLQMMQFQLSMQKELLDMILADPKITDADKDSARRQYMDLLKSNSQRINSYLPPTSTTQASSTSGRPPLPLRLYSSPRSLSIDDAVELPLSRFGLPSPTSAQRSSGSSMRSNTPTSLSSAGSNDTDHN
jgi:hypothetical protein